MGNPKIPVKESEIVSLLEQIRKTLAERFGSDSVFALGRMRNAGFLDEAFRRNAFPKVPVFCSGLGMDLVNHFTRFPKTPIAYAGLKVLKSIGARPLPRKLEPSGNTVMIYLVSSGMMVEHTRLLLASGLLRIKRNSICCWLL